jgi:hypothetical protein
LLHEMLHAFLGIYTCNGLHCPSMVACKGRLREAIGDKGHKGE